MTAATTDDLSALAWVHAELRRSLEAANKALRRHLKESEAAAGGDVDAVDPAVLRAARAQLHQGVGALELVGLPAVADVLRAAEAAVQRMAAKPALADAAAIGKVERVSFALLDFLSRQLAGKPVSPVALFPQYRAALQIAGADRIHPADLWKIDWQWRELPDDPAATPRAGDDAARAAMEDLVLALMRDPGPGPLARMSDLCADLAAGARTGPAAVAQLGTFWQLAAAMFEAQAVGLLAADVHSKRIASRLLAQLRMHARCQDELSDRLAQDLLFFCSHARPPSAGHPAPRLAAVRRVWQLDKLPTADYDTARLGRFDPAVLALARKRVAAARETWSGVAGEELHRLGALNEQFALVGESLQRLFPAGDALAQSLAAAAAQTVAAGAVPSPALAMEVATAILYLDASVEDGEFDHPELQARVQRLAQRIDDVRLGAEPQPLDAWMEELYRRVSDRQTMGSVVHELRASLSEVEKQIDQYFRDPAQRQLLIPVPAQLSAMRGVLSVLGFDQASAAVLHMRDDVDALAQTEVDPQQAVQAGTFDRLADNLGALSFLIDMLSVQPALAKSLFRYDPETGSFAAVMGQTERISAFATFDDGIAPASPPPQAPPLLDQLRELAGLAARADVSDAEIAQRIEPLAQQALAADQRELARLLAAAQATLRDTGSAAGDAARRAVRADLAQAAEALAPPPAPPAPASAPIPPARPAPAPGGTGLEDDAEMREIFIEEAREVVADAGAALERLADAPDNAAEITAVRRAFHTLKGSARMVGLRDFGEAGWSCEQLYNARLAQAPRMDGPLRQFTLEALAYLGGWVEAIAAGVDGGHHAAAVAAAADALRTDGARVPLLPPDAAAGAAAAPAEMLPPLTVLPEALAPDEPADAPAPVPAATPAAAPELIGFDFELDDEEIAGGAVAAPPPALPADALAARVPGLPSAADLDLGMPPPAPAEDIAFELDLGGLDVAGAAAPAGAPPPAAPSFDEPLFDLVLPELPPAAPPLPVAEAQSVEVDGDAFELAFPPAELPAAADEEAPLPAVEVVEVVEMDELAADVFPELADAPRPAAGVAGAAALPPAAEEAEVGPAAAAAPIEAVEVIDLSEPAEVAELPAAIEAQPLTGVEVAEVPAVPVLADAAAADAAAAAAQPAAAGFTEEAAPPLPPEAAAEPEFEAGADDDQVKVIGTLRIGIPLFNIYLNEADELSRRLGTELAEWSVEHDRHPVPDSAAALAHSLAGSSATVGYGELSALARALEHALLRSRAAGPGRPGEAELFGDAADEIRRVLHQFAAGFLKPPAPALIERLAEHERAAAERAAAQAHEAQAAAADAIDADLFPIFEEEADELLPQLQQRLRAWLDEPSDTESAMACMRTLHTLKGGARLAGAMRLGELAHALETDIEALAAGGATAADVEPLLLRADAMTAGLDALRQRPAARAAQPAAVEPAAEEAPAAAELPEPVEAAEADAAPAAADDAAPVDVAAAEAAGEARAPAPAEAVDFVLPAEPLQPAEPPPDADALAAYEATVVLPPPSAAPPWQAAGAGLPRPTTAAPAFAAAARPPAPPPREIDWARFDAEAPAAEAVAADDKPAAPGGAVVRVRAGLLDRMVNQAGEVSITRARIDGSVKQLQGALGDLTDSLERMRRQLRDIELQAETQISSRLEAAKATAQGFDPLEMDRYTRFQELTRFMAESVNDVATLQRGLQRTLQAAEDELAAQARLTRELQDDLLRTRMVEFESMADRLHRTVRQAARDAGKQVRLDLVGGAIEIDRGVLERMAGAFEHLLRNAVAHGIETPAARAAAGKDAAGALSITVSQSGNEVAVDFADDGAGFDLDRIRRRGVERGLIAADAAPADAELVDLVFRPGFSTADAVTALAGRGVGLDVVRAEVAAMGGRIETESEPGRGTRFKLLLPLTTAVTQVVMLRCGDLQVAVPSTLIEIVRRVPAAETARAYAESQIGYAGADLAFYWLAALLGGGARGEVVDRSQTVVVVRSAAQRVALHVDEVVGNQEVVVKNVGSQLARMPGLVGVTLLPSGAVALIYNPVALAALYGADAHERVRAGAAADALPAAPQLPAETGAPAPLVLVVDDSLTVRRVTQRLLVREGYRVATAKDGLDAIEKLAQERPVVLLSDIEMPRMDGFDLVRNVRADSRLAGLPVVMITSRIAQKHRDHAAELGVDHYLGKPYAEEELLALVARYAGADIPA